jgi:hypothetical protein
MNEMARQEVPGDKKLFIIEDVNCQEGKPASEKLKACLELVNR